jgi:hypothetical protein
MARASASRVLVDGMRRPHGGALRRGLTAAHLAMDAGAIVAPWESCSSPAWPSGFHRRHQNLPAQSGSDASCSRPLLELRPGKLCPKCVPWTGETRRNRDTDPAKVIEELA